MGMQCNTKLLLLVALILIAIILTGTLVPILLHEQKKAFYWRLFLQSQHVEVPITVIQGDTVHLNGSDNPCNYSSFWYHGNCELCGWNRYLRNVTQYYTNTSCYPQFTCINETKGLQLYNITLNDSGAYTEHVYECELSCNITNNKYEILNYFDNCTYTINSTKHIITVVSSRYSKHTEFHVTTHVGFVTAAVTVIIICLLIYFNVPATLRRRLRTRNNVNRIT
ncbi:membrane protein UL1 [Human betaherpesvirus 5]|uniref:Membrane protein UL1 n=1 Tax=Human cytomegalovirus TaxID=10359 RepID=A0A0G2TTP4_HCMV|nr:membrane protein UL1 [Human betaherpesvirus 5]AMO64355.1 membrane protein UL1 [Human betaherpesvirus 5]